MKKLNSVRVPHLGHLCEFMDHIYVHIFQYIFTYSPSKDHFIAGHLFYMLVLAISWFLYLSRMKKFNLESKHL